MKKILYAFASLIMIVSGCKKQSTPDPLPQTFISYFKDTSGNKPTGLIPSSESDLEYVPFVEDIDTFFIHVFGRTMSPSSWSMNVPPPDSQYYNSCVGWAIGYGMLGYQYKVIDGYADYSSLDKIFSATYIWNQLNGGVDKGTSICKALKLVREQGCCKWSFMPSNISSYTIQPTTAARMNASNYKLSEFMRFKTIGIELLKHYLSKNYPIPFGAIVDSGFMTGKIASSFEKKQDGRLVWKENSGVTKGNHAMLLCGYDDNINAFKVLNSWGKHWGNEGFIWIDYNFFKTVVMNNFFLGPELYLGITRKYGTVTDIDGNMYRTLKIGNQEWMVDNLKTTRYRNGNSVSTGLTDAQWGATTTGAYSIYNNDSNNNNIYGKLYNWYAVADSRNIAPVGWHVPSDAEWTTLSNYLRGDAVAGGAMKETGIAHWLTPNTGATNSSGFSGLPGGNRGISGAYNFIGDYGIWWSSTGSGAEAWFRYLRSNTGNINRQFVFYQVGHSVRCVRD